MIVSFKLVGTRPDLPDVLHFTESSGAGKSIDDMQKAYEHFRRTCNVNGLRVGLRSGGGIVLKAENNQLRPEFVADIRRHAKDSLAQI